MDPVPVQPTCDPWSTPAHGPACHGEDDSKHTNEGLDLQARRVAHKLRVMPMLGQGGTVARRFQSSHYWHRLTY